MTGPELKQHAANGSPVAQTEIDRRAAKKAVPATAPQPKPEEGHTGTFEELQKSHPIGAKAYSKGYGIGTIVQHHPAKNDNSSVTVDFPGHGLIKRNTNDVSIGDDIPAAAKAAVERRKAQQVETDRRLAARQTERLSNDDLQSASRESVQNEIDRRLAELEKQDATKSKEQAAAGEVPAGYVSNPSSHSYGGVQETIHNVATGSRIGSTYQRANKFGAYYNGKRLDEYPTRAAATKAVVDQHKIEMTRTAVHTAKALQDSQKAAAGTPWEARAFEHDDTSSGMSAARKIKQSFKFGNHTVTVEPSLTKAQTQDLLSSIHQTVTKANLHHETINFHVPTGDKSFRERRGKATPLGYIRRGTNTVYINPKVTTGEKGDNSREVAAGHFMPSAANTSKLQYTLTHEIGHVLDGSHHHTRTPQGDLPLSDGRRLGLGTKESSRAREMLQANRADLSKYGNTSSEEAYAEAYAQWIHGGPGSSKVADEYAKEFGWAPPQK